MVNKDEIMATADTNLTGNAAATFAVAADHIMANGQEQLSTWRQRTPLGLAPIDAPLLRRLYGLTNFLMPSAITGAITKAIHDELSGDPGRPIVEVSSMGETWLMGGDGNLDETSKRVGEEIIQWVHDTLASQAESSNFIKADAMIGWVERHLPKPTTDGQATIDGIVSRVFESNESMGHALGTATLSEFDTVMAKFGPLVKQVEGGGGDQISDYPEPELREILEGESITDIDVEEALERLKGGHDDHETILSEWDQAALTQGPRAQSKGSSTSLGEALDADADLTKDVAFSHEEKISLGSAGDLTVGVEFDLSYSLSPSASIQPKMGSVSVNFSDELTDKLGGIGGKVGFDIDAPYLLSDAGFNLPGIAAELESTKEGASASAKVGTSDCHALFSVGKPDDQGTRAVQVGVGFDPLKLMGSNEMTTALDALSNSGLRLELGTPFEFLADISSSGLALDSAKAAFEASGQLGQFEKKEKEGEKKEGKEEEEEEELQNGLKFGVDASVETDYGDLDPEKADFTEAKMETSAYVAVVLGGVEYRMALVDWKEASRLSFLEEVETVWYWQSCALQGALEEQERARRQDDLAPTAANRSRLGGKVNQRTTTLTSEALAQLEAQAGRKLIPWKLGEMYSCDANGARFSGSHEVLRKALARSGTANAMHDWLCGEETVADIDGDWSSADEDFGSATVESSEDGLLDLTWGKGSAFGGLDGGSFSGIFSDERYGDGRARFDVQQNGSRLHLVLTTDDFEWTLALKR